MENKVIVLGSILAVSAVTIALCVMGKKDEVKSNACGCEENSNMVDGGAGTTKESWTKKEGGIKGIKSI